MLKDVEDIITLTACPPLRNIQRESDDDIATCFETLATRLKDDLCDADDDGSR
jgi:hypothetical protein